MTTLVQYNLHSLDVWNCQRCREQPDSEVWRSTMWNSLLFAMCNKSLPLCAFKRKLTNACFALTNTIRRTGSAVDFFDFGAVYFLVYFYEYSNSVHIVTGDAGQKGSSGVKGHCI